MMSSSVLWLCLIQMVIWTTVHSAAPVCTPQFLNLEVASTEPADFLVSSLDAICNDPDGDAITFSIANGNYDGLFKIDGNQLRLAKAIPKQITYKYVMRIEAKDSSSTGYLSATVIVNFNDNDNDPVLTFPPSVTIAESQQIGSPITRCIATDADDAKGTLSGVSRVGITSPYGVKAKKFTLDSVSGELFVNTILDYEKTKQYVLVIEAWDLDPINPRRVNKTLTINVQDVNDNRPTCQAYDTLVTTTTTEAVVDQLIFTPNCVDADSGVDGQITYSMDATTTAPASNLFEVESSTGIVKVKSAITDTNIPFYEVVILVKDGGSPSLESKMLVRVVVTDASGPAPSTIDRRLLHPAIPAKVTPGTTTGRTPVALSYIPISIPRCELNAVNLVISETQAGGTELYDLKCTDPEGGELYYEITKGDPFTSFEIKGGKFILTKPINGDFTSKLSVHIEVSDPTGLSTNVVVAVYITNINDNNPVIKDLPTVIQVKEDQPIGAVINSCSVNEKDSKQSLPPAGQTRVGWGNPANGQNWFLDIVTCDLYVNTVLDYETTKSYTLELVAYDLDPSEPRTVSSTFTVSVLDVNDNPPVCQSTYDVPVPENATTGTVLATVNCTDADSGDNAKVFFKLSDANEAIVKSTFTVGGSNGDVTVQAGLDFETRPSYNVEVIAYDDGLPSLSATSTVRVTVTDVEDGTTATNTSVPSYTAKPTVDIQLEGNNPVAFEFFCKFAPDTAPLWYLVNWYVDGHNIYTTPRISSLADVEAGTKLTEAKLAENGITTVGFDISCDFRASYADDSNLGNPSPSDPKFIGIRVLTKTVDIVQGQEGVIQIQATAPIGCNTANCDFPLYTFIQQKGYDCAVAQGADPCGVNIQTSTYANIYEVKIKGGITFQYGKGQSQSILKLRSPADYSHHKMWSNYELEDVEVTITQDTGLIEGSKCAAFVDPRIVTFDKGLLDLQEIGVYTLYSHPATKSEIQIQSYKCDEVTGAHCICGVALRTGKTVFKLNHCNLTYNVIKYTLCDDASADVLKVEMLEKFYQVYFPTGTRVTIFLRPNNMNVFIYPSVMDVDTSLGLCGKLSGKVIDDLVKRDGSLSTKKLIQGVFSPVSDFFESWKVSENENLFNIEAGVNDGGLTTFDGSLFVYDPADYSCRSLGVKPLLGRTGAINNQACSIFTDISRIQNDAASTGYRVVQKDNTCKSTQGTGRRRRRSVQAAPEPINMEEDLLFRERRSVWKNGWTNETATKFCDDLFNQSSMVSLCKDLSLVDITSSIIACYQDIQLSGSANYSLDTMSAIRSQCIHEVSANDSFLVPDVPGEPETSKFAEIIAVACPGECSQRGVCIDGECNCNEGYGAIDCSVDITDQPLLVTLENDGYCDIKYDDCSKISAFGETFVAGANMRCKTTYFELIDGQEMIIKEEKQHTPFLESISEAICTLPPQPVQSEPNSSVLAYGYRITLTNDGQAYSEPNHMIIYNSECQECNINSTGVTCFVKKQRCASKGYCYEHGARYNDNQCYTCEATDTTAPGFWTKREDEVCVDEEDGDDMLWIIGLVLGVVALILIAGVIVFLLKRKKKNKISLSQTRLHPEPCRKFSKTNLNT